MGDVAEAKPGAATTTAATAATTTAGTAAASDVASDAGVGAEAFATKAAAALATAAEAGHAAVVTLLLQGHASAYEAHGPERWTPYHLACAHDRADCLEALVRHGCDERARDAAGRTGAQLAAERRAV